MTSEIPRPEAVPGPVRALLASLAEAGYPSLLVGGCVRDMLRGRPVADFDIATPASADELLALLPRAIPIGLRHGTVMVPTRSGPVDVTAFRKGPCIEDDLAHRDFTVNAMAYDPDRGRLVDPFGGRADLARGVLRAVGSAADRFAEDPLRALRACRLVAVLGLRVDAAVEAALAGARPGLARVARERIRHELCELLLAEGVAEGLTLLRRSSIESDLAPGAAADAGPVAAALPADLDLRVAAWLRGARSTPILRGLRFPRRCVEAVAGILRAHPIEEAATAASDAAARRVLRRLGERRFAGLAALRRAELVAGADAARPGAAAALARLAQLEEAVARVRRQGALALRRFDLALDGAGVMRVLGCGPGPRVGRALRYLTDAVVEDPSRNTPEALRALLEAWAASEARSEP
jgi:tRNA nucleotidyltransferase (CCA-adding enzyme)